MSQQNRPSYEGWTNYETYAFMEAYGDDLRAEMSLRRKDRLRVKEVKEFGMKMLAYRIQDFAQDALHALEALDRLRGLGKPETDEVGDALRNNLLIHATERVDIEQIVNEVCWEVYSESEEGAMAQ